MIKLLFIYTAVVFSFGEDVFSQQQDSVKSYKLEEITIKADKELESKTITEINFKEIEKADAGNISELAKLIPSVKVQTNSRGETLFYLRGAGERQIMLFFDGVPLNIPWDNRIDLSLLPAEAIGNISVTRGIPSVVYGANAISGVININSLNRKSSFSKILFQRGENNSQRYSALYLNNQNNFSYLLSTSFSKTDGYNLSESYHNSANLSKLRINSYNKASNFLGKVNYHFSDVSNVGLGISYISSEKGVPPETDVSNPRFWKYPIWKRLTISLNGKYTFKNNHAFRQAGSKVEFSFAGTNLESQIDQFTDASFSNIDDIEKGNDLVLNGRIIYSNLIGSNSILKAALNGFTTTHKENIQTDDFVEQIYVQNVFSAGIEFEHFFDSVAFLGGVSYDVSTTPKTGDKESKDPNTDYSFNFGIVNSFNDKNSIHISFGRKTRFPTLRETFSGALGRFVPNQSLKAEVSYSSELGFTTYYANGTTQANLFLNYLNDGIVRITLPGSEFQRVNKDQIRTFGIEISSNYNLLKNISAGINISYLNSYAKNSSGSFSDTLEYKPQFISSLNLNYSHPIGFETLIEGEYIGKEFGLQEGNEYFQKLPEYFLLNLRLAYKLKIKSKIGLEFYARVNNIFDKLYFTQWSLPEAGRQFFAGISAEF